MRPESWMTSENWSARDWMFNELTVTWDNDEPTYRRLREAARLAVQFDMGTGVDAEMYRMALAGRGPMSRSEFAHAAGERIAEEIDEMIREQLPSCPMRSLLVALLDYSDSALWDEIGDHFLPDGDDIEWEAQR